MKYIKNYLKFRPINEDHTDEIGITYDYDDDFSSNEKDTIEEKTLTHIADLVESGFTNGELYGEDPDYHGWWEIKIENNDDDLRNEYIANQIRKGIKKGYDPNFEWYANIHL